MPTGRSTPPTLKALCREAFKSDKPYWFGAFVVGPMLVGAFLGQVIKDESELRHKNPPQAQAKAAQSWRANRCEVTGLKSDAVGGKDCEIRKIAPAGGR